jgi:hypothetical protein
VFKILYRKLKLEQHEPHKKQVFKILYRKLKFEQHEPHKKQVFKILYRKLKLEQHEPPVFFVGFMLLKLNRFLHESLLKIWDFFHECEKFRLFTSGAQRNEWKNAEFLSRVEEIPDLQKTKA